MKHKSLWLSLLLVPALTACDLVGADVEEAMSEAETNGDVVDEADNMLQDQDRDQNQDPSHGDS